MRTDIRNAKRAFRFIAPEQVPVLDEIEKQFATEFDYRREAANLARVRANLVRAGFVRDSRFPWSRGVVEVPRPRSDLCRKDVLVMDLLDGVNLVDGIRRLGEREAERRGTTLAALEASALADFDANGYPEPYDGPSAATIAAYRLADAARCRAVNAGVWVARRCGFSAAYRDAALDFNPAAVVSTLAAVHGHEMLVDGFFNGDPHAGNFLLLADGRIGLLDYGQVKELSDTERLWLCEAYVALVDRDVPTLRRLADAAGLHTRRDTDACRLKMLTFSLDRDGRDVTGGLNFQQFLDRMYAEDPWDEVAPMIVMPSRLCVFLRGIGLMLNHPLSCAAAFGPIAARALADDEERRRK